MRRGIGIDKHPRVIGLNQEVEDLGIISSLA